MESLTVFLGNAWVQLAMWVAAGMIVAVFPIRILEDSRASVLIATGVSLYGLRIGYKLLPFYKMNEYTELARYAIGLVALVILFFGLKRLATHVRSEGREATA